MNLAEYIEALVSDVSKTSDEQMRSEAARWLGELQKMAGQAQGEITWTGEPGTQMARLVIFIRGASKQPWYKHFGWTL